eukprot:scaffold4562_cov255-Pinguiococcus_pyrenoidosus.AAC.1
MLLDGEPHGLRLILPLPRPLSHIRSAHWGPICSLGPDLLTGARSAHWGPICSLAPDLLTGVRSAH